MRKLTPMRCHLCHEPAELVNSHVIPEFLYRPGYDEKGRLLKIEGSTGRKNMIQKGLREPLLCVSCERRLGVFEKYFADFWYQTNPLPNPVFEDHVSLSVRYGDFKLFLLSILWRSSISTLEQFSPVKLGPFEKTLRQMLLAADPGTQQEFPIIGSVYLIPTTRTPCHGTIMPPGKSRGPKGSSVYSFVFGGVGWFFYITRQHLPDISRASVSLDGNITLAVNDLTENRWINEIFDDHFANRRHLKGSRRRNQSTTPDGPFDEL